MFFILSLSSSFEVNNFVCLAAFVWLPLPLLSLLLSFSTAFVSYVNFEGTHNTYACHITLINILLHKRDTKRDSVLAYARWCRTTSCTGHHGSIMNIIEKIPNDSIYCIYAVHVPLPGSIIPLSACVGLLVIPTSSTHCSRFGHLRMNR